MEQTGVLIRNTPMQINPATGPQATPWRHWPLWRLLGVIAVFAAIARFQFGVRAHDLRQLPLGLLTLLELSLILSVLSGLLGTLVLGVALLWPLQLFVRANNLFFDGG